MLTSIALEAALAERYPDLAGDPGSVLVVEGLANDCTPQRLRILFEGSGNVRCSCVIYDNIGDRTGVVVFHSAASCVKAERAQPALRWYRRVIQAIKLDRRNRKRCYSHLRNLIGVLNAVSPSVIEDPYFLERSVLVEGVALGTSPPDLLELFDAQEAVLVRDAEFGDLIGLVVLKGSHELAIAVAADPPQASYCCCFPASGARPEILKALDACARLRPCADLLRSLIPPEFIFADQGKDLHLRCVFLSWPATSDARGPFSLCRVADEELLVPMGFVRAVVIRRERDRGIGVLVCDLVYCTEMASARADRLRESGLLMYDSSLFPLPAAAAAGELSPLQRLLPPFVTPTEYTDRVVWLKGLDTAACDASEVARFLEVELKLKHIDAVIVHEGGGGVALVAAHTTEDAQALLQVPREPWFRAFARAIQCELVPMTPTPRLPTAPAGMELSLDLWDLINPLVIQRVRCELTELLDRCDAYDLWGFVLALTALAAMSQASADLGGSNFSDRAVLLMGTGITDGIEPALRSVLSRRYGSLHALVLYERRRVGMAIFRSWIGAARLLRDPNELLPMGIQCHPAPDAATDEFAAVSYWVIHRCLIFQGLTAPFL